MLVRYDAPLNGLGYLRVFFIAMAFEKQGGIKNESNVKRWFKQRV